MFHSFRNKCASTFCRMIGRQFLTFPHGAHISAMTCGKLHTHASFARFCTRLCRLLSSRHANTHFLARFNRSYLSLVRSAQFRAMLGRFWFSFFLGAYFRFGCFGVNITGSTLSTARHVHTAGKMSATNPNPSFLAVAPIFRCCNGFHELIPNKLTALTQAVRHRHSAAHSHVAFVNNETRLDT